MDPWVGENERVDDLLCENLKIIQSREVFSFSMDAVLLARFCSVPSSGGAIMDLCTGNGVVAILLTTRTKSRIKGVEIQERLADMALRSVKLNGLEDRMEIVNGDIRQLPGPGEAGKYDLVTVNPPYLPAGSGDRNLNPYQAIARHEISCSLSEVITVSAKLVRSGGRVAMVHRPSRLIDILALMRSCRLEPKRLRLVHPRAHQEANMVLIEAVRDGRPELRLLPPLIVYGDNNAYAPELLDIYYGDSRQLKGV